MADLTLPILVAVLEEMFGPVLFWVLVTGSVVTALTFAALVVRDRGIRGAALVRSELWAPVGGLGAILFVRHVTDSSLGDIGGPIDLLVVLAVGLVGAAGATVLSYVLARLFGG